ncbi:MAG: trigger factor [Anaerolineae bacterium]
MKVTTEVLEGRELRLSIEVEPEELEKEMRAAAQRISRQVQVPGFRKGKAPYHAVVRTFGREAIREEALESLGPRLLEQALKEAEIRPYDQGVLEEVTKTDPPTLRMKIPLAPLVELGDYRSLRVEWVEPTVPDEKVEEVFQDIAEEYSSWEVKEGPVEEGDLVRLDIGAKAEDGRIVLRNEERSLVVRVDSTYPLPGVQKELLGLRKGEEKVFSLTFPEDAADAELAGKVGECRVVVHEVMERRQPAIDDDLAQLQGDYETLADLRAEIRERLLDELREAQEKEYEKRVLDALRAISRVELPALAIERELDFLLGSQEKDLGERGLNWQTYLTMLKTTPEAYRETLRPLAEEAVVSRLLLTKVAEAEHLEPDAQEVDSFLELMRLRGDGEDPRFSRLLNSPGVRELAADSLRRDKALEWLVRLARGEDVDAAPAEGTEEQGAETEEAVSPEVEAESPAGGETQEGG